jgi:hypothetical protein
MISPKATSSVRRKLFTLLAESMQAFVGELFARTAEIEEASAVSLGFVWKMLSED